VVAFGLLSACASRPQHIEGRPVSANSFLNQDCQAISSDVYEVVQEVQGLIEPVNATADENHVRNAAAGMFTFMPPFSLNTTMFGDALWVTVFPATQWERGESDEALRLEHLKGKYLSLQQAAVVNGCDNVKVQSLAAYIPARYQSSDDKTPYEKVFLGQYSRKVITAYEKSQHSKLDKFRNAVNNLDTYLKHDLVTRKEYRYAVSLLIDKHVNS
jgi:hypothetical protein